MKRGLFWLTAAIIFGYFLYFNYKSLFLYFDPDDTYNLYMAWSKPLGQVLTANLFFWNGFFRPLGAMWYRGIFALAGFHPFPFHLVDLILCTINMALCFWFARLVTASDRIAALTTLIFAFHTRLMEVWFRTAVVYDVLCFTFLYLALCLYIAQRRKGWVLGPWRMAAILICFVCALDSKEMAVCLPVLLIVWELLLNRADFAGLRKSRALALVAVLAIMAGFYTLGKLHGPNSMATNPFYKPEYTWSRFSETWSVYLEHLFVMKAVPPVWFAMLSIAVPLAIALIARSRKLLFAWTVMFFGLLPVSFAPARGGFVMYISYPGWALYAAIILVAAQDLATARHPQYRTALACAIFVLTGYAIGKINLHDQRADPRYWLYQPPQLVRTIARDMSGMHPELPLSARVLFVDDAFGTDEYTPLFILRLMYDDPSLAVDRVKMMQSKPADWASYDYVFTYEGGAYRQLKPG